VVVLQGLSVMIRVGANDRTVHPFFTRRMSRLLMEEGINVTYSELADKEHWWWDTRCVPVISDVQSVYWYSSTYNPPFPSNSHHRSNGDCLEAKRENYQVCSVQYYVQRLCAVQRTHVNGRNSFLDWVLSHWAHFTVLRFIFLYVLLLACVVL